MLVNHMYSDADFKSNDWVDSLFFFMEILIILHVTPIFSYS